MIAQRDHAQFGEAAVAGPILRLPEMKARTGLSRSAIYDRMNPKSPRYDPNFPKNFSLGGSATGWFANEVDAWLERCAQEARKEVASTRPPTSSGQNVGTPTAISKPRVIAPTTKSKPVVYDAHVKTELPASTTQKISTVQCGSITATFVEQIEPAPITPEIEAEPKRATKGMFEAFAHAHALLRMEKEAFVGPPPSDTHLASAEPTKAYAEPPVSRFAQACGALFPKAEKVAEPPSTATDLDDLKSTAAITPLLAKSSAAAATSQSQVVTPPHSQEWHDDIERIERRVTNLEQNVFATSEQPHTDVALVNTTAPIPQPDTSTEHPATTKQSNHPKGSTWRHRVEEEWGNMLKAHQGKNPTARFILRWFCEHHKDVFISFNNTENTFVALEDSGEKTRKLQTFATFISLLKKEQRIP